jgi:assimilatory nitrate reductase catalytic subunit
MGGREVGGLANMLAAHMGFSTTERDIVRRFWNAPNLVTGEGYKAVEMFEAIEQGRIKALWVIGSNPAVSMPRADGVRRALDKLELLAVSDVVRATDTLSAATVHLPAQGWSEKDGTVTNSERRISRQRPFMTPAGGARPDWWILSRVAARLGWEAAFAYQAAAEIFAEHAALTGFENQGARMLDLSSLSHITAREYDALEPVQWPVRAGGSGTNRVFADGLFATLDRKARFVAVSRGPRSAALTDTWPMLLNTGRIRDQWHTMTRTGLVPRLTSHISEPFAEINTEDAQTYGIHDSQLVRIESAHGNAVVKAVVTNRVPAGSVFAPIHWSGENSSAARIGALVHGLVDPISGQPDLKATPARVSGVEAQYSGFILSTDEAIAACLSSPDVVYWSRAALGTGFITNFAIDGSAASARRISEECLPSGARISFSDEDAGVYRTAVELNGRIGGIVVVARGAVVPPGAWLKSMLTRPDLTADERRALLAGGMPDAASSEGPIVCVCHQIGMSRVAAAIEQGCGSSETIGKACLAGTNCGSCLPEINRMLRAARDASV